MKEAIETAIVDLKIEEKVVLYALLGHDGTINRLGTGTVTNQENDLFIGRSDESLFHKYMAHVDETLFEHTGQYTLPDPKGQLCTLTLLFYMSTDAPEGKTIGFQFIYGSESQGPPKQIVDLVIAAVDLTDEWYQEQKRIVRRKPSGW